ncbi:MAG TPA: hypothetical protein VGD67_14510 [Pseudonocardiaceae bacterium]
MAMTVTLGPRPGRVRGALAVLPLPVLIVVVALAAVAVVLGLVTVLSAAVAEVAERATTATVAATAAAGRPRRWRGGWACHRDVTDWVDAWRRANARPTGTTATTVPAADWAMTARRGVR